MNEDIDQIEWPNINGRQVQNPVGMARGFLTVRRLCGMGLVTEWLEGRLEVGDVYTKMPHRYQIEGWNVQFQPHWEYIAIERGPNLHVSSSAQTILKTINRLKKMLPPR